jgi:hypothetical protein
MPVEVRDKLYDCLRLLSKRVLSAKVYLEQENPAACLYELQKLQEDIEDYTKALEIIKRFS